ncbi:MAG: endolytic transglycosylase MltG [Duodenibacillus sp.]
MSRGPKAQPAGQPLETADPTQGEKASEQGPKTLGVGSGAPSKFSNLAKRALRILTGMPSLAALALVLAAGAGGAWWYFNAPVRFPAHAPYVDVVVTPGASGRAIANAAMNAGLEIYDEGFLVGLRLTGAMHTIHAGRYRMVPGMTHADIVAKLESGQVESFALRVPDGATFRQLRMLVQVGAGQDYSLVAADMTEEQIMDAVGAPGMHAEGWFAPETYHFRSGMTDLDIYRAIFREQKAVLDRLWEKRSSLCAVKTPYEALILASLIEKETGRPEDRGLVSSVFNNRLRARMPLQTDPAVIYGLGDAFDGNLTKKHLQTPGPYNTYLNGGLPPSPICLPSRASLEAAVQPEKSHFYYFVARGDGTTYFSKSLQEHNRAVEKYQKRPARQARAKALAQKRKEAAQSRQQGAKP